MLLIHVLHLSSSIVLALCRRRTILIFQSCWVYERCRCLSFDFCRFLFIPHEYFSSVWFYIFCIFPWQQIHGASRVDLKYNGVSINIHSVFIIFWCSFFYNVVKPFIFFYNSSCIFFLIIVLSCCRILFCWFTACSKMD